MPESVFHPGHTVADVCRRQAMALLAGSRDDARGEDAVTSETAAGAQTGRYVEYTLSGNGPGSCIVFLWDGDEADEWPREATFAYYENGAYEAHYFGPFDAARILAGLNRDPDEVLDEDDADDEDEV